jgi:negative regulator of replication initiation
LAQTTLAPVTTATNEVAQVPQFGTPQQIPEPKTPFWQVTATSTAEQVAALKVSLHCTACTGEAEFK